MCVSSQNKGRGVCGGITTSKTKLMSGEIRVSKYHGKCSLTKLSNNSLIALGPEVTGLWNGSATAVLHHRHNNVFGPHLIEKVEEEN